MTRNINRSWVAGVASGLAQSLNWPVSLIRAFYIITFFAFGLGFFLYLAAWLTNPQENEGQMNLKMG